MPNPSSALRVRPYTVSIDRRIPLGQGWTLSSTAAGLAASPDAVPAEPAHPAEVPGTIASARSARGGLDLDADCSADDAMDHWYRGKLPEVDEPGRAVLVFEGLATLADAWIDGTHVLRAENMFRRYEVDVSGVLGKGGDIALRFASLAADLKARRGRPRWRARILETQQLRWVRTTLLGRMPFMGPRLPPVGPYRAVALEVRRHFSLHEASLSPSVDESGGAVRVSIGAEHWGTPPVAARLLLSGPSHESAGLDLRVSAHSWALSGELRMNDVALWWPHTHGGQPRYDARVELVFRDGTATIDFGKIGFRTVTVDRGPDGSGFSLFVNGVRTFCRGACWNTESIVSLGGTRDAYRTSLDSAVRAGMNMLRVGGTMLYEADDFYDLCDELGILVWQDFQFASMDYPSTDPAFLSEVTAEAEDVLSRLSGRPCLAVLCGSSETEQQAAMLGLPREEWDQPLFAHTLKEIARELAPTVPYVPSSPTGGDLPFQVDTGVAHYYGVGAYLRPFDDVRRASVKFATECLAFSNVPAQKTIDSLLRDGERAPQHPRWKARVPRDRGVGWDFEDVRDHYLRELFGVDPLLLRYSDVDRYLVLSRLASGEAMLRTFAEWRRVGSACGGGLVWFYKDFWPGAGWGVLDAHGRPKAAYHYLRRAFAQVALFALDEGTNGLYLHAVNDGPEALEAELRATLYRDGEVVVARAVERLHLGARSARAVHLDRLLPAFTDTTYAYRFGPPTHDVCFAELVDSSGTALARAFHFPTGLPRAVEADIGLEASPAELGGGPAVRIRSRRLALGVSLELDAGRPSDDFFHLEPGGERVVTVEGVSAEAAPANVSVRGRVSAANARSGVRIK